MVDFSGYLDEIIIFWSRIKETTLKLIIVILFYPKGLNF